jgi:hypothetical protein
MEGIAQVVSVTRQPIVEVAEGVEAGGSYTIVARILVARIYPPADNYSKYCFQVKISKPIDLADKIPSAMDHGRFTFYSDRQLKVGDQLDIDISPA